MKYLWFTLLLFLVACTPAETPAPAEPQNGSQATFAGGCFWCVEHAFDDVPGVLSAVSGYAGGEEENPEYKEVASGRTGHREAVRVTYDPSVISYEELLDIFWHEINPTDAGGQFADRGFQYSTAIYYHSEEQKELATLTKTEFNEANTFGAPIVTEITESTTFYVAEEYHQDYAKKNPVRYNFYRSGSGRDRYLEQQWAKSSEDHQSE